jgi:flagellar basal body-associated protein FliL
MAEPEAPAKKEEKKEEQDKPEAAEKKSKFAGMLPWLIPVGAAVLFIVFGFAAGRLFGTRGKAQNVSAAEANNPPEVQVAHESKEGKEGKEGTAKGGTWYHDTEAVIVNLNEPGVSRYVRMSLTLELGNGLAEAEGKPFLEQRKPLLKHWLTLFLSNQTIDDIRGEKNLRQIQNKIMDIFNQGLWPDAKPRIVGVYFKEYSIQ